MDNERKVVMYNRKRISPGRRVRERGGIKVRLNVMQSARKAMGERKDIQKRHTDPTPSGGYPRWELAFGGWRSHWSVWKREREREDVP